MIFCKMSQILHVQVWLLYIFFIHVIYACRQLAVEKLQKWQYLFHSSIL